MTRKETAFILAIFAAVLIVIACMVGTKSCHAQCGSEKITQKDLTFADTAFLRARPIQTTVKAENALPNGKPRLIALTATVTGYKLEADGDIHCILADGSSRMIMELPNPECPEVKKSSQYEAMKRNRAWFLATIGTPSLKMKKCNVEITVTGSEFFDKPHGQAGMAKNAVEIHPPLLIAKR